MCKKIYGKLLKENAGPEYLPRKTEHDVIISCGKSQMLMSWGQRRKSKLFAGIILSGRYPGLPSRVVILLNSTVVCLQGC